MIATRMDGSNWTVAMIATACFFNDLVMPHAWAACMDVGGRYAASVAGTMNLMGNLAGASSTMVGGFCGARQATGISSSPCWPACIFSACRAGRS